MKIFFVAALLLSSTLIMAQPKKIAVIGSSTAYGHFSLNGVQLYPRDSAWTFKLKAFYKEAGIIDTLYNLAASGNGPYHGMPSSYTPPPGRSHPYYPFNITRAMQYHPKPSVLIVSYPTNQYDYLSKAEIIHCLQTIKDSANSVGMLCYISTSQPRDNFSPAERIKLKQISDTIMHVFGPWAIDFFTELADTSTGLKIKPEYSLGDGVHLNPAGHEVLKQKVIAKNIFPSTVPVTLINFNAQKKHNGTVNLQWQTVIEINSSHFKIQRSADGVNFSSIGEIANSGNSQTLRTYQFTDEAPLAGNNFYRIVTVDQNNQKQFSEKLNVKIVNNKLFVHTIYPNPVGSFLNIKLQASQKTLAVVNILTADGKIVYSNKINIEDLRSIQINCSQLKAGMYLLKVKTVNQTLTQTFIKL